MPTSNAPRVCRGPHCGESTCRSEASIPTRRNSPITNELMSTKAGSCLVSTSTFKIGDRLCGFPGERHVHAPRLERRRRRAALRDDRIAQPVEVGPVFHEVVAVLHVLDELALAPVLDLERSRAHAAGAVAGRRHMRGVDRRESGGQHQQEGWLWVLQSEHDRLGVERVDRLHLAVHVYPRVDTQLCQRIRTYP